MKILSFFSKSLYSTIVIILLIVVFVFFLFPANNLTPSSMFIAGVLSFILFLFLSLLWSKLYPLLSKYEVVLHYSLLILLGATLFLISFNRTTEQATSLGDYSVLYYSASEYASGRQLENPSFYYNYFSHYYNNIKPMLLLSWLFSLADLLHLSRFHFVLFLVCIQIVLTAWSIGYLISSKNNKIWRVPSLIFFSLMLPLYGMTASFYTDTMSMGLPIIAMALIKLSYNNLSFKNAKLTPILSAIFAFLSALMILLSTIWKITTIIPLIGCIISFFLCENKFRFKYLLPTLLMLALLYSLSSYCFNCYEITQSSKLTSDPLTSWIAIGLKSDGSFSHNRDFVNTLHELPDTSSKLIYTKEYIIQNSSFFLDPNHLLLKFRRNFADGTLNTGSFTTPYDNGSIYWDLFNPYGKLYWRVSQITYIYMSIIYFSLLCGAIKNVLNLFKKQNFDILLFSTHISFLGILIFLMLWEANSRQLYNQMPTLILSVFLFLRNLFQSQKNKSSNKFNLLSLKKRIFLHKSRRL